MKIKLLALVLAAALLLAGCFGQKPDDEPSVDSTSSSEVAPDNLEYPLEILGAELDSRPGVVVSLSPALTEKLVEMGLEDRLAGVSDDDDVVDGRVACGTAQAPDIEAIKDLSAHLLLTASPLAEDDEAALMDAGVKIALVPRARSFTELLSNYQSVAMLMDGKKTGAALGGAYCKELDDRMRDLEEDALGAPKVAVYLTRLDYSMATGDTLENELMEKLGFVNVARSQTGWTFPENLANAAEGRAEFEKIDYIFCDRDDVTMPMMEQSEFWRRLNCVLKDYYLYVDGAAFDRQTGRMLDELERMLGYANGEVEGGAVQEQTGS